MCAHLPPRGISASETAGADGKHHPIFRILAAAFRRPRPDLHLPLTDPSRCSFLLPGGHLSAHVTCSGKPWCLPGSIISLVHSLLAPPCSFFYPSLHHGTATTNLALSGLRALVGRPLTTRLTLVRGDLGGTEKVTQKSLCSDGPVEGGPRMGRLVPRGPWTRKEQPALSMLSASLSARPLTQHVASRVTRRA